MQCSLLRTHTHCGSILQLTKQVNVRLLSVCKRCAPFHLPPLGIAEPYLLLNRCTVCASGPLPKTRDHNHFVTCAMPGAAATASHQATHVLVHNGAAAACVEEAGAWLKAAPRGAYTTARTVGVNRVFKLESHIQRLATSANLIAAADRRANDHIAADLPLITADELRPLVVNNMAAAVRAFESAEGAREQHEVKLTVLLTWSGAGGPEVWCHGEALPPRPRPPIKAVVRGAPRVNAKAKDSEWVRQRQVLEAAKPGDANEVILVTPSDEGGALMEGLSSNFFVLQGGAVVTADEGVLSGTVRELILEVCAAENIPVQLRPPLLSEMEQWQGAFISSTSRLLLPLDQLVCPAAHAQQAQHTQHTQQAGSYQGQGQQQQQQLGGREGAQQDVVKVFGEKHQVLQQLEAAVLATIAHESGPLPL